MNEINLTNDGKYEVYINDELVGVFDNILQAVVVVELSNEESRKRIQNESIN